MTHFLIDTDPIISSEMASTLTQVAEFFGVYYMTVSRTVRFFEKMKGDVGMLELTPYFPRKKVSALPLNNKAIWRKYDQIGRAHV